MVGDGMHLSHVFDQDKNFKISVTYKALHALYIGMIRANVSLQNGQRLRHARASEDGTSILLRGVGVSFWRLGLNSVKTSHTGGMFAGEVVQNSGPSCVDIITVGQATPEDAFLQTFGQVQ